MRVWFTAARAWLLAATVVMLGVSASAEERPNLVYILLDDAGYGDLSCYGQEKFQTPQMDRLAKEGMRFTDHYSGSTVCAPTRCSLMTGKHTGHTIVRGNREVKPEGQAPMPADTVTLPRLLHQAGYTTGMFGKWGLGAPGSPSDPAEHFDVFYGYNCQRQAHSYYPTHLWSNRERVELDGKTYSQDLIMAAALQFIRDNADRPFFCYLPVTVPHAAMHSPESAAAPFRKKWPQFEDVIGRYSGPQVQNPVAAFAGMMTHLDTQIGELLALLEKLKIDDKTLVMLSSDNGPHQEGGHDPEFFNSNGPFRGHKRDLYEGGIRAPLLARWPGKIAAGSTSALISAHWDILPTFCELAGATIPADTDGLSLVPTLLGNADQQPQHDYLYWEFGERGRSQAVRQGNWKGVRRNLKANPKAPLELYNLASDIGETTDVADKHPEIAAALLQLMQAAHVESETFPLFD
ncbi:arylsulfatase [Lignipirellula cremea]|uniref:Arylsulfatase n=1 Tax=Lignipirellula cremea TaxID=2528010 RepID=A0A518E090_9BACT|nr:arylsulfatase [Lignipirellula cremea]QDU97502.1 Arylsulfatase [Lignipirellula cremea]